jgi:hypothetical protein
VEATQEFFLRVIEEASQVDNGEILFRSLRTEKGIEIMELLVKVKHYNSKQFSYITLYT